VLAVAVSADDAKGRARGVDGDHGMQAVRLARAAEIFEGFTGAIGPGR